MKELIDKFSLVILGKWNTIILTPEWIKDNVLEGKEPDNLQIAVPFPVDELDNPVSFIMNNIKFITHKRKLTLGLAKDKISDGDYAEIKRIALELLDLLKHTPVYAFGLNFYFEEEITSLNENKEKNEKLLNLFNIIPQEIFNSADITYTNSLLSGKNQKASLS